MADTRRVRRATRRTRARKHAGRARRPRATRASARATYVYCVLEGDEPDLRGAPAGLPGCGPLRALDAGGGLWLVAAAAPLPQYGDRALARGLKDLEWVSLRALAHENVVEHCLALGTVLPMKLFTLFRGDDRALQHVAAQRRRLRALARRVRGRREWGVRLGVDEPRAPRQPPPPAARGAGRGRAYLLRKTRAQALARGRLKRAVEEAERAFAKLSRLAAAARRRPPAAADLLLDAAFLVGDADAGRFRQAVRALQRRLARGGLRVALTGPWPAYNFVTEPA